MTPPSDDKTSWAQKPERSSMAALRLMTWLSLTLGRRFSRLVLYPIALYFLVFAPSAKRASKTFLSRALGRVARVPDGFKHVLSFASVVHDRVYWLRGRFDLFDVKISGEEHLAGPRAEGRGIVLVGGHFGSFEALRVLGERHGIDAKMLMYPDNARMVTAALAAINPALVDSVISLGRPESILHVREHLSTGGCVGILADRTLDSTNTRAIPFLDEPANFPLGPFRLAAMLRAPVVFMAGVYLGGNRYHLHFESVLDFADVSVQSRETAITAAQDRFVDLLQQHCKKTPWNWFNFYDFWHENPR
ncbi:acyl-CoA synthetase [Ottowia thiooxydans]|uniref:LpxL/LpxP family acyltransferase n=1 Tax=Ottowia thiooxydans TaxID=219182 RepID=UPI00041B8261|nr:acyl-CoA synthetase [Ottowia thiooxydans]